MTDSFEPPAGEHGFVAGLQTFHQLERRRIRDILLVSSLFDFYLFEEEGLLYEQIQSEYRGLQLANTPEFTRVSSGAEALAMLRSGARTDLIITTLHIEDMSPLRLAREIREFQTDTPIVLLGYDNRELNDLITHHGTTAFDRIFVWEGDFRLLIAIIKNLEDALNVRDDTSRFGVQCIMLIEDSIHYASYFLPLLYSEVIQHSQRLISEGLNAAHRSLRMRARPKILLCRSWEEAEATFNEFEQHIIGVISDVDFPRCGETEARAGFEFARLVKSRVFDVPVLLQSSDPANAREAAEMGALFIAKNSPTLPDELRRNLQDYFALGDFIFRTPEGNEVGRATDLRSLEEQLSVIPPESLLHHAARNNFSTWLKARTEFSLAARLRPRRISDYASADALREDLIRQLHEHRSSRQRGLLTEFEIDTFDPSSSFARIGAGSVGGKARGLAFLNTIVAMYNVRDRFQGLEIDIPAGVIVATDVFDEFLAMNGLQALPFEGRSDEEIHETVVNAPRFPRRVVAYLADFLQLMKQPLAVRSSSLLEDSQYHPFAGVYQTFMIPNSNADDRIRLRELITAIKRVYASTFYRAAREYLKVTSLRAEDEKMAVIIQQMVGAQHGNRFYPEISGVARSYNFYPVGPQKPDEGIVSVALGLGKTIVEGGSTVRFCPRYPDNLQQFFSPKEALRNNQNAFYALDMTADATTPSIADEHVVAFSLAEAEADGTLQPLVSTYSAENDALYEGASRPGARVVTFAPILRGRLVPLAQAIDFLNGLGTWAFGTPVEIEFAVTLSVPARATKKLALLQIRPLLLSHDVDDLTFDDVAADALLCKTTQVLGHGIIDDLHDVVVVDAEQFERLNSRQVATELAAINSRLVDEGRRYLLVGPGRWGSLDPLLGVPVKWDQICGAKVIVEAGFRDMSVDPSQGSHFFQNLTAFQVGYFSVGPRIRGSFVDWETLAQERAVEQTNYVRHLRLERPLIVKMNGHTRCGVILRG